MSGLDVIVLGGRPRDGMLLCRVLGEAGIDTRSAESVSDACAAVADAGALLIAEERLDEGSIPRLRSALGQQPPWSDLPLLVMLRAGAETAAQLQRTEALLPMGKPVLLERPLRIPTLLSAVRSALAARDRQYEIRMFLAEREERERELAAGQERYRLAALATREAIWEWDIASGRLIHGPAIGHICGTEPDGFARMEQWQACIHPDDRDRVRASRADAIAEAGDQWQDEYRVARTTGGYADVLDRAYLVRSDEGRALRMIGAVADVTERKRAEAQQALLLAELNHRVRNILAVITSLATQSIRRSSDLAEFNEAFVGRLQALSRVHGLLTKANWTTTTLDAVAREALAPHDPADGSGHVRIGGPAAALSPRTAQAFSLLFHELGTNAVKYGALSQDEGRIDLAWQIATSDDGTGEITIVWSEHGGPPVTQPGRRGFGSLLIEQTVRFELKGRCTVRYDHDGLRCRIELPWPQAD